MRGVHPDPPVWRIEDFVICPRRFPINAPVRGKGEMSPLPDCRPGGVVRMPRTAIGYCAPTSLTMLFVGRVWLDTSIKPGGLNRLRPSRTRK
jgi:hypothetical protein